MYAFDEVAVPERASRALMMNREVLRRVRAPRRLGLGLRQLREEKEDEHS